MSISTTSVGAAVEADDRVLAGLGLVDRPALVLERQLHRPADPLVVLHVQNSSTHRDHCRPSGPRAGDRSPTGSVHMSSAPSDREQRSGARRSAPGGRPAPTPVGPGRRRSTRAGHRPRRRSVRRQPGPTAPGRPRSSASTRPAATEHRSSAAAPIRRMSRTRGRSPASTRPLAGTAFGVVGEARSRPVPDRVVPPARARGGAVVAPRPAAGDRGVGAAVGRVGDDGDEGPSADPRSDRHVVARDGRRRSWWCRRSGRPTR